MNTLFILVLFAFVRLTNCNNTIQPDISNSPVDVINQYRVENGLAEIPESKSLNFVAEQHVYDLEENQPVGGNCNLHSRSDKGDRTCCCYTSDHAQAECMWNKPRELTSYTGDGFEIAASSSNHITPEEALELWKSSTPHHNVILNRDYRENFQWQAIGAATYKGYAVVWFGTVKDEE